MKSVVIVLSLFATIQLVLGVSAPGYGPSQPLQSSHAYRTQNGGGGGPPIPVKYPAHHGPGGGRFGNKNEFFSKYNPHSQPPGVRGPPPPFTKFPSPPSGKQQQQQQHHHQQKPHLHTAALPNFRPLGPQLQSKPHLFLNGAQTQGGHGSGHERVQHQSQPRPTPKITNIWSGPKVSAPPDFPSRFPPANVAAAPTAPVIRVAPAAPAPLPENPKAPYIINSDDERGPIKTIPAPNLNPADRPVDFEQQLYNIQHQQSYAQPLDNSITDDKLSAYQVTEDPSVYKPFNNQPSYFAPDPDTVHTPKVPPTTDYNSLPSNGKVPLDVALQQHLDKQHQQLSAAEHVGSADSLTPQELYSLLNGNSAAPAQNAYVVQQPPVMFAIPQPQPLDAQVGQQLQYQPQVVQLQYAQQPAAAVQLQYAQPGVAADHQYLQPQAVQYQPQTVQYQPQTVQYQPQAVQYQPQDVQYHPQQSIQQQQQQQQQQQPAEQFAQQQKREQQETDGQYQNDYEPRNRAKETGEQRVPEEDGEQQDPAKFESIRDQYYSAVPNEQTASVLAQIAESAANNDVATADESSRVDVSNKPAATETAADNNAQSQSVTKVHTTVQVQQSVPLYEGSYASSRRTNQEYADEGGDAADELMEGSESAAAVSESVSMNGHAPSQFPYNAAKINAFASN